MSEAAENVEDLLVDGVVIEDDNLQAVTEDKHEDKPAPRGYMSKEAWVESGKDPDEWVSEEVFKERGERIKQTTKLQKEFDNQIKNLNLLLLNHHYIEMVKMNCVILGMEIKLLVKYHLNMKLLINRYLLIE